MRIAALVLPLVVAAGALSACGSNSTSGASGSTTAAVPNASGAAASDAAGIPCTPDLSVTATPAPPTEVPFVPGGVTYLSKGPFGTTTLFFESVAADPKNLDATRDAAAAALKAAGFTPGRSDQEEGSEAEATLTGPKYDVAIQVIQLCVGHVRVKYTLTPGTAASASATVAPSASASAS